MGFGSNKGFTPGDELTMKEIDGAPSVPNVKTIVVSNGTLADNGGGQVTLTIGGGGGGGDVDGPAGATNNAIARYDTGTGKLLQDSVPTISDTGELDMGTQDIVDVGDIRVNRILDNTSNLQLRLTSGQAKALDISQGSNELMIFNCTALPYQIDIATGADAPESTPINIGKASTLTMSGSILPNPDNTYDLGSPAKRWANVYTGDLHLANDRGNWTVIEESDFLSLRNNKTGKRFKIMMEEITEDDE